MPNVVVERAIVNEIVTDIIPGNADTGIVWEDLYKPNDIDIIYISDSQNII